MKRREFLQLTLLSTSGLLLLGENGWAVKAIGDDKNPKRLVVVFLRGAVDGLNVVVPYSESSYYTSRPTIAAARPERRRVKVRPAFRLTPGAFFSYAVLGKRNVGVCSCFRLFGLKPVPL